MPTVDEFRQVFRSVCALARERTLGQDTVFVLGHHFVTVNKDAIAAEFFGDTEALQARWLIGPPHAWRGGSLTERIRTAVEQETITLESTEEIQGWIGATTTGIANLALVSLNGALHPDDLFPRGIKKDAEALVIPIQHLYLIGWDKTDTVNGLVDQMLPSVKWERAPGTMAMALKVKSAGDGVVGGRFGADGDGDPVIEWGLNIPVGTVNLTRKGTEVIPWDPDQIGQLKRFLLTKYLDEIIRHLTHQEAYKQGVQSLRITQDAA